MSLVEGIEFSMFFRDFYTFLRDIDLFQLGLADLSRGTVQVPSGERKLILSMANTYADTFLRSPQGTPYTLGKILDAEIPVQEVDWLIRLFLLTCLLTVMAVSYDFWREIQQGTFIFFRDFFSTLMPLLLVTGVIGSLW